MSQAPEFQYFLHSESWFLSSKNFIFSIRFHSINRRVKSSEITCHKMFFSHKHYQLHSPIPPFSSHEPQTFCFLRIRIYNKNKLRSWMVSFLLLPCFTTLSFSPSHVGLGRFFLNWSLNLRVEADLYIGIEQPRPRSFPTRYFLCRNNF